MPEHAFHGVIHGASLEAVQPERFRLRLEVGTKLHLLELGQDVRLFQNLSIPDIVKDVLKRAEISEDIQSWHLEATYPKYDAITQYNESDSDFIRRLLAREGIAFVVRNDEAAETLVFFDNPGGLAPIEGGTTLVDRASTTTAEDTILRIQERALRRLG